MTVKKKEIKVKTNITLDPALKHSVQSALKKRYGAVSLSELIGAALTDWLETEKKRKDLPHENQGVLI